MFTMRKLLSFAALALLANALPTLGATSASTPADGADSTTVESFCQLDQLSFTNGLTITKATSAGVPQIGGFQTNWFHYVCQVNTRNHLQLQ